MNVKAVVRPTLLPGSESGGLRKRQEAEPEWQKIKMSRFSLGIVRMECKYISETRAC